MDGWTDGRTEGRTDRWTDGWTERWTDKKTDAQMDGWTDRWMDRWPDGQPARWNSEASRDPQFGLKEAIIGIPGLPNSVAVAKGGNSALGLQNLALTDGPAFINPAKYLIPAGGAGKDGYNGPSLNLLVGADKQTLVRGSVSVVEGQQSGGGIISDQDQNLIQQKTHLSFAKYLRELNEIEIDPYGSTLLLYVVALLDMEGEYNGNPEWQSTTLTLLANSSDVRGYGRKRSRHEIPHH
jgi:hypothetical protein